MKECAIGSHINRSFLGSMLLLSVRSAFSVNLVLCFISVHVLLADDTGCHQGDHIPANSQLSFRKKDLAKVSLADGK